MNKNELFFRLLHNVGLFMSLAFFTTGLLYLFGEKESNIILCLFAGLFATIIIFLFTSSMQKQKENFGGKIYVKAFQWVIYTCMAFASGIVILHSLIITFQAKEVIVNEGEQNLKNLKTMITSYEEAVEEACNSYNVVLKSQVAKFLTRKTTQAQILISDSFNIPSRDVWNFTISNYENRIDSRVEIIQNKLLSESLSIQDENNNYHENHYNVFKGNIWDFRKISKTYKELEAKIDSNYSKLNSNFNLSTNKYLIGFTTNAKMNLEYQKNSLDLRNMKQLRSNYGTTKNIILIVFINFLILFPIIFTIKRFRTPK